MTLKEQWEGLFHWSQVAGSNPCPGIPWAHPSLATGITNALLQWPFHGIMALALQGVKLLLKEQTLHLNSAKEQKLLVQALEKMRWNVLSPIKTSPKTG